MIHPQLYIAGTYSKSHGNKYREKRESCFRSSYAIVQLSFSFTILTIQHPFPYKMCFSSSPPNTSFQLLLPSFVNFDNSFSLHLNTSYVSSAKSIFNEILRFISGRTDGLCWGMQQMDRLEHCCTMPSSCGKCTASYDFTLHNISSLACHAFAG